MSDAEFWELDVSTWQALNDAYYDKLEFIDTQFATLRYIIYTMNSTARSQSRTIQSFKLMKERGATVSKSDDVHQQLLGAFSGIL